MEWVSSALLPVRRSYSLSAELAKKRARAFPTLMEMVEARKRNDPPDNNYKEDKRTLVLTGELV
jgi:hypothetical protein